MFAQMYSKKDTSGTLWGFALLTKKASFERIEPLKELERFKNLSKRTKERTKSGGLPNRAFRKRRGRSHQ
jgi:hypothetical protein